jgi:hypothetical protein
VLVQTGLFFLLLMATILIIWFVNCYRKRLNFVYIIVLFFAISHVLRPIALWNVGSSVVYADMFSWDLYLVGFLFNLFWFSLFLFGFRLSFSPIPIAYRVNLVRDCRLARIGDPISIFVILAGLSIMFSLVGLNFLSGIREGGLGTLPQLRPIYPFVMLFGALLVARALFVLFEEKRLLYGFIVLFLGFIATAIINQRGLAIMFLFSLSIFFWRYNKKVVLFIILTIIALTVFILRQIVPFILGLNSDFTGENRSDAISYLSNVAKSPDGADLEVLVIAQNFVQKNGFLLGESIINFPLTLMSSDWRFEQKLFTGLDFLNDFYQSDIYWGFKYGFNVTSGQEMYLNFGFFGLVVAVFAGFLVGRSLNKYEVSVSKGQDPIYSFLPTFALINLLSSFAGFMWSVVFYLIYMILSFGSRIVFHNRRI